MHDLAQPSVLIVDDNPDEARITSSLLKRAGITKVSSVLGHEEALDQLENGDFNLVLMDVKFPEVNGGMIASVIEVLYGVPVIYVTAYSDSQTRATVRNHNAIIHGYLVKSSLTETLLQDEIERVIYNHGILTARSQEIAFSVDTRGIITFCSGKAAEMLFCEDMQNIIGKEIDKLLSECHSATMKAFENSTGLSYEVNSHSLGIKKFNADVVSFGNGNNVKSFGVRHTFVDNMPFSSAAQHLTETRSWDFEHILTSSHPKVYPGVYVLGCFDKCITFYAQQVRALQVIRAMFDGGDVSAGDRVAIIGGGVAGVTAAQAAAYKGCEVVVFEKQQNILALQSNAGHRYLHPHIYDWPNVDASQTDAMLPSFCNWQAGYANSICDNLRRKFESSRTRCGDRLQIREIAIHSIETSAIGDRRIRLMGEPGFVNETFDAALIAIGFGLERERYNLEDTKPYWTPDDIDGPFEQHQNIFVSGAGDGGLIDLARATLRTPHDAVFRHDSAIKLLTESEELERIALSMREADATARHLKNRRNQSTYLIDQYNEIPISDSFIERFRSMKRHDTSVTFNYRSPGVFSLDSQPLNRLLAMLIIKSELVEHCYGEVQDVVRSPAFPDKKRVRFRDAASSLELRDYDKVILRFGPLSSFFNETLGPRLFEDSHELRGAIRDLDLAGRISQGTVDWYS